MVSLKSLIFYSENISCHGITYFNFRIPYSVECHPGHLNNEVCVTIFQATAYLDMSYLARQKAICLDIFEHIRFRCLSECAKYIQHQGCAKYTLHWLYVYNV